MTIVRGEDRVDPPVTGDEAATLLGFLNYQRDTLRWKCSGLRQAQLNQTLHPTTMTLAGIIKHLAVVEAGWFNRCFAGGVTVPSWYGEVDWEDQDWSFKSAATATPEQLFGWLDESIGVSDRVIRQALDGPDGLDALSDQVLDDGRRYSLRWIITHMIEEYARHNGHADLLREAIDGSVGE